MTMSSQSVPAVRFSDATRVQKLDSHTYKANLEKGFCIVAVPNGGYAGSCMLAAAADRLAERRQPDMITAHFEYPERTFPGPAIIKIEDIKLGSNISRLHLTLWQGKMLSEAPWIDPASSSRKILAYSIHADLNNFDGFSLPTGYEVTEGAALPPQPDFNRLKTKGGDDVWEEQTLPKGSEEWHSLRNWQFFVPRQGPLTPGVMDVWIRLASGERIVQGALPYVFDSFPYNTYTFLVSPEFRKLVEPPKKKADDNAESKETRAEAENTRANLWMPTLVMNIEAKTRLPEEGVEWLAMRVSSKQIKDGKFDLEINLRDEDRELISLGNQIAMIVSMEKNTKKRDTKAVL